MSINMDKEFVPTAIWVGLFSPEEGGIGGGIPSPPSTVAPLG
jgi:hypothetical protein